MRGVPEKGNKGLPLAQLQFPHECNTAYLCPIIRIGSQLHMMRKNRIYAPLRSAKH
jgi:hypothetical protein